MQATMFSHWGLGGLPCQMGKLSHFNDVDKLKCYGKVNYSWDKSEQCSQLKNIDWDWHHIHWGGLQNVIHVGGLAHLQKFHLPWNFISIWKSVTSWREERKKLSSCFHRIEPLRMHYMIESHVRCLHTNIKLMRPSQMYTIALWRTGSEDKLLLLQTCPVFQATPDGTAISILLPCHSQQKVSQWSELFSWWQNNGTEC